MNLAKTLYLFPDTNIFLQCKPLEQVDWSSFAEWDNIQLILTRPVQAEIDAFKGKGNGRQASKARAASTLIRRLLDADDEGIGLHSSPAIHLYLRHDLRRDESVAEDLNYEERDDQLVGTALAFQKTKPTQDVKLLTNDTGPMASAKAVGLAYHVVPPDWLLQSETDDAEKREKALKTEIAKYKSAEPIFEIKASHDGPVIANISVYNHLTDGEVRELVHKLTTRYPLETYFGSIERQERSIDQGMASTMYLPRLFGATKEVFEPATSEQIEQYKNAYAEWKETCHEVLLKLHETLNSSHTWPTLTFRISNVGSRPADDALVVFEPEGTFYLVPAKNKDASDDAATTDSDQPYFPRPPVAPKGTWKRIDQYASTLGALARYQRLTEHMSLNGMHVPQLFTRPASRDPNGFYFKEGQAGMPSKIVSFICSQWRHAHEPENFEMSIHCPRTSGTHAGLLRVTAHAANLTTPEVLSFPLRLTVTETSSLAFAEKILASLED
ncbi:PIN domain-containing protein [Rhodoferax sp. GW822-FHT02A01]|uniref:PIN domain-containing protein n=1 Tax=Rhodoferax sp. GW822-FHT02A01 TaxID=3141537 RepID=UPI00315DA153